NLCVSWCLTIYRNILPLKLFKDWFFANDLAPNGGEALLRRGAIERALEFEVPKGHVPKLAGIVERVMPFDLHAAQSMGLPGAVDRKVAGLGTGYNRDLYA